MAHFVRIAQGYDTMQVTLAITALEGAGFVVLAPGRHFSQLVPQLSVAVGPVPILVPEDQAEDAMDFLEALETNGIELLDVPELVPQVEAPDREGSGWWWRIWNGVFAWLTGVAPSPPRGLYREQRPRKPEDHGDSGAS